MGLVSVAECIWRVYFLRHSLNPCHEMYLTCRFFTTLVECVSLNIFGVQIFNNIIRMHVAKSFSRCRRKILMTFLCRCFVHITTTQYYCVVNSFCATKFLFWVAHLMSSIDYFGVVYVNLEVILYACSSMFRILVVVEIYGHGAQSLV